MLVPTLARMAVEIERLRDQLDDPQRERDGALVLVGLSPSWMIANSSPPSRASTSVSRSDDFSRCADFDQQLIAGGMPQRVVDRLEPVEVEHQHGEGSAVALQALAGLLELLGEQRAVGQAREHIVLGQMDDLGFGAPPLGDVFVGRDPAASFHRLPDELHEASVRRVHRSGWTLGARFAIRRLWS